MCETLKRDDKRIHPLYTCKLRLYFIHIYICLNESGEHVLKEINIYAYIRVKLCGTHMHAEDNLSFYQIKFNVIDTRTEKKSDPKCHERKLNVNTPSLDSHKAIGHGWNGWKLLFWHEKDTKSIIEKKTNKSNCVLFATWKSTQLDVDKSRSTLEFIRKKSTILNRKWASIWWLFDVNSPHRPTNILVFA